MKNSLKLFVVFALLGCFFTTNAQSNFGFRVGVTNTTFNNNPYAHVNVIQNWNLENTTGLDAGVFYNIPIGNFSIQPEFHYIQKGHRLRGVTTFDVAYQESTLDYQFNYLEMPVLVKYNVNFGKVSVNPFAGMSVGYGLNAVIVEKKHGLLEGDGQPGEIRTKIKWDDDFSDIDKDRRFDFGAVAGMDIQINLGKFNVILDGRYLYDLNNHTLFDLPDYTQNIKNRGFAFSAGLGFNLK